MPNASPNPESHWFGFRKVDPSEKTARVKDVFASVASNYDLMNDLMSGGLHRLWKDQLVRMMNPKAGQVLLDVAGGTGDIALRCWNYIETAQSRLRPPVRAQSRRANITVCDINPAMLNVGRARAIDLGILPYPLSPHRGERARVRGDTKFTPHTTPSSQPFSPLKGEKGSIAWITGNAEELPIPNRSVDLYSIAFGLRNVTHIDKALQEAVRVLKPGGRFYCMEFSPGVMPQLKPLYDQYCLKILPKIGALVAKDRDSYQYLAESIQQFPTQPALAERMKKAGLEQVQWLNLTGGIAVIHWGWKL